MILHKTLEHRFVKHIPEELEVGVLYISMEYGSVVHSCCCGCGHEVVTPLTPTDWKLIFDGETVSLRPSVGSWALPCRSHYVIDRGRVLVAEPWSYAQVTAGRRRDRFAKAEYYGPPEQITKNRRTERATKSEPSQHGVLRQAWRWLTR